MDVDEGGPFIKLSDPGIPITVLTREGECKVEADTYSVWVSKSET